MLSVFRGLLAGLLLAAVAATCPMPTPLGAQDVKKDAKKDPKDKEKEKEDLKSRSVGFGTSDGLTLNGYFFQGSSIEKQRPDAVIMMPAPGSRINDSWISLARGLSEKNFSVLLFDWRGCGLNSVDGGGPRIFEDKDRFWREPFNRQIFLSRKTTLEEKGLDWKQLVSAGTPTVRYRDFALFNDLLAARYFLDRQSDAGRCNTNRVWIVSEKDGSHVGLAFIAAEFQRNTIYRPNENLFDTSRQFRAAGKDYAGMMAMSYSGAGSTAASQSAAMVYRNALPATGANELVKEGKNHLADRLAMVLMYNKAEGATASKSLIQMVGVNPNSSEEELKRRFKYLKEFDIKLAKKPTGIELIDENDSFGVRDYVVKAMVEISVKQNFGKDPTDREAARMVEPPRFEIEKFNRK